MSAIDGNWGLVEKAVEKKIRDKDAKDGAERSGTEILQATRDSVRAIMMIRAFRMRGHLHADLDPLGIAKPLEDYNELSPQNYGFTEADYDRPIFIDHVLGLAERELGLAERKVRVELQLARRDGCRVHGSRSSRESVAPRSRAARRRGGNRLSSRAPEEAWRSGS